MFDITRMRELEDKPHKRIYRIGSGQAAIFAKIHATPKHSFGSLHWDITASHCQPNGKAIPVDAAKKLWRIVGDNRTGQPEVYEFTVQAEAGIDVEAKLDAACLQMVQRVIQAVLLSDLLDANSGKVKTESARAA